jgi:5-methylcytosine-specific restriction endonuclease McrA
VTRRHPMKRTRLRKQSAKARAMAPARKACMAIVRKRSNGICEYLYCREFATDGHEILRRSQGGSPVDPENVVHLCREHHNWVHSRIIEAVRLGLLARRREGR